MKNFEKSVVFGDSHIPFQNILAHILLIDFIKDFKPDKIFINGDLIDCWEISAFDKPLHIEKRLKDEINHTIVFLDELREVAPKAEIIYIFGNHEFRFERYIARNARELYGLRGLTLEEQLELERNKIEVINNHQRENYFQYGKLLIGHFNKALKHSAYTAKNLLEDKGMSLIQSHCFSEDTQILTKNGWKNYNELYIGQEVLTLNLDTNNSEWNKIEDIVHYNNFKELIHFKNKVVDLLVTPQHAIVGSHRYKKFPFKRIKAREKIGRRVDMICGGKNINKDYPIEDELLKLLGWCITEGNYTQDSCGIRISQSEKPKVGIKRITDICDNLNQSYSVRKKYSANTVKHGQYRNYDAYSIRLHSSDIVRKIRELAPNKQLQWWMLNLSNRQFKLLFRELILADGCKNKDAQRSFQYSSKHEEEIDILQAMCALNGFRSSKIKRSRNGTIYYVLTINTRGVSSIENGGQKVSYNGLVWCVSVKNKTVVVRRNGKVIVSGNTHRLGSHYKRDYDKVKAGYEIGCMCNLNPNYIARPNWQQGFAIIQKDLNSDFFKVTLQEIIDNRIIHGDKIFET